MFCLPVSAVHFTVTADVTSFKPRLRFQGNMQSVYSGYLSMPRRRCETLRVGLLVRHTHTHTHRPLQTDDIVTHIVLMEAPPEREFMSEGLTCGSQVNLKPASELQS